MAEIEGRSADYEGTRWYSLEYREPGVIGTCTAGPFDTEDDAYDYFFDLPEGCHHMQLVIHGAVTDGV
jgi:hypothetical protein